MGPGVWTESFTVRYLDTDATGFLAVDSLCDFLQEAAGGHVQELGVSVEQLGGRHLTWVLSRLRLRVDRFPGKGERVAVTTWPSGINRLFALRDFRLSDGDGAQTAAAVTAWLLVDLASRRPVRTQSAFDPPQFPAIPRALDGRIEKLAPVNKADRETSLGVRLRDLDTNGHVNNARIVQWIAESVGREVWESLSLSALDIDFLSEIRHGEQLLALAARSVEGKVEGNYVHAIVRQSDGAELARARTAWQPRPRAAR